MEEANTVREAEQRKLKRELEEELRRNGFDETAENLFGDNWKHRSRKMLCKTCMYFVPKKSELVPRDPDHFIGRCRRNAPTIKGFPVVFSDDWCGAHKIDEDKLG